MLKGIPSLIPPDLMKYMIEMGHGDEIVIADGNFPTTTHARRTVRCDGHAAVPVMHSVLQFLPIENHGIYLMKPEPFHEPEIWIAFRQSVEEQQVPWDIQLLDRYQFYERAARAYVVVATGETALYANVILTKGVVHI